MSGNVLTSGTLASFLLELLKYAVRFFLKNKEYDFPFGFYVIALPVMQAVSAVLLAVLGVDGYYLPDNWLEWVRALVLVVISSAVSVVVYDNGISNFKKSFMPNSKVKVRKASAY